MLTAQTHPAHSQPKSSQTSPSVPTIRVTSRLVFLDVTVLDKQGRPVVSGLTKSDFLITEDKQPQRIFSFEPPQVHTLDLRPGAENPDGKAPRTILVLDLLNSRFQDFAYIRYEVKRYLDSRPPELGSPTEMMVVGNQSLQMVQNWTRDRSELLDALQHIPAVLPYKEMSGAFWYERAGQSVDALQQIALQNQGVPGRKNIIWVGHGMPNLDALYTEYPDEDLQFVKRYLHATTNMLVNARISLFVIYPGLNFRNEMSLSGQDAFMDTGDDDPFLSGLNFGIFTNETGGRLFYNRNDVDGEIRQAKQLGSEYYTLTYQPQGGDNNGRFRRIRVTLREPGLRALTKTGYFARESKAITIPHQRTINTLSEGVYSTIPLNEIHILIANLARHPDNETTQFTVYIQGRNLDWLRGADGHETVGLGLAAASIGPDGKILASRLFNDTVTSPVENPKQLGHYPLRIPMVLRTPRKTQSIRVVVEVKPDNRMGSAEMDRKAIAAAPALPTPEPQLSPARSTPPAPSAP